MNITGTTNTCIITANIPFYQSGNTEDSSSTSVITITDENGLDLTTCFGVTSSISTVTETNISTGTTTSGGTTVQSGGTTTTPIGFDTSSLTGACQNILIIEPVTTGTTEVECLYTGVTYLNTELVETDGLILVTYSGGSTSLNVHPDCCISLDSSYTSEIGSEHYFVCRYREFYDVTDCDNYTTAFPPNIDIDDYIIFTETSGGTTTLVPSIACCSADNFDSVILSDGIRCKVKVAPICADYIFISAPEFGDAQFTDVSTGLPVFVVPTIECCTTEALHYREVTGGFACFNSPNPPTVEITSLNSLCCEEIVTPETGLCEAYGVDLDGYGGNGGELDIINCAGYEQTIIISPRIQETEWVCMIRLVEARGDIIVQNRPSGSCEDGSSNNCFSYDVSVYLGYSQVTWTNCDGSTGNGTIDGAGDAASSDTDLLYIPCAKENSVQIIGSNGNTPTITKGFDCSPPTCFNYDYGGYGQGTLDYIDCNGVSRTASFSGDGAGGTDFNGEFCAKEITGYVNYLIYKGTC
jgi:hypothetical protein